jgi:hypothetical protein
MTIDLAIFSEYVFRSFPTYDAETRSLLNESDSLTVISWDADGFGGLNLELSGGVRLQVFPDGAGNENWRFFSPGSDEPHFVHEGVTSLRTVCE